MSSEVRHPASATLALCAGGELPFLAQLRLRWHLSFCEKCAREVQAFQAAREEWERGAADDVEEQDGAAAWNALEAEMRANIRLGLTADSLVSAASDNDARTATFAAPVAAVQWRWAAVGAALVFVLIAGWSLRPPAAYPVAAAPVREMPAPEPARQEQKMQLLAPVADVSRTETDFDGSTRSRVIDGETGQVTLQQVYVE